jgi:hypothetical protein
MTTNNGASNRGERESLKVRQVFLDRLAKVADGSAYTLSRLEDILGIKQEQVLQFIRQCEVSPGVTVHRLYGSHQLKQYTFTPNPYVDCKDRIADLVEEILSDPNASGRAQSAAQQIKVLLGG